MRRQRGNKVLLAFDGYHRVVFAAEDEGWTLDARQHREKTEGASLTAQSREPKIDLGAANPALCREWISFRAGVDGEGDPLPRRKHFRVKLSFDEAAARQRTCLRTAEAFE
jgi:hypothetical protein